MLPSDISRNFTFCNKQTRPLYPNYIQSRVSAFCLHQLNDQGEGEEGGGAIGGAGGGEEEEEGGQQVDFQCILKAVNKADAEHDHAALVAY